MDEPFRVASFLDDEAISSAGDLQWLPLRRRLGVEAFGINAFRASKQGEIVIEEHVESPGQEELYLVVAGQAEITVGDETITAPTGTALFVSDPTLKRSGRALEDGTVVVAIGGWPDKPYHSLPWEPIYLAMDAMRRGDWAEAAETLEREAGEHRDTAIINYRLACCHARLGQTDLAFEELTRAIEINPGMRERAQSDEHFDTLRDSDRFPACT